MSESTESTQPIKAKKRSRLGGRLLTILGVLVLLALAAFGGARAAIGDRVATQKSLVNQQLAEQFQFALVDMQFNRYEAAKQRLEFIIAHDPGYPGAQQKLTEVLVGLTVPTATSTPVPSPTPNPTGAEGIFAQAQQLIAAGDWANALVAIDEVRKADPGYQTAQVDGMYYFVLRNYGYDLIINKGNLEGGIYEFTRAERFGPLDNTAAGLREGARAYITAASFWEVNWEQAVAYLSQVAAGWPSLWDGTLTAGQRYWTASMRYGDQLFAQGKYCDAVVQYQNAAAIAELDDTAQKGFHQSFDACYPATGTPTATGLIEVTPTDTGVAPSPPPTETQALPPATTEPPPAPSETPTSPPVPGS